MSPRPASARRARPPGSSRAVDSERGRPPTGGPVRSDSGKNKSYRNRHFSDFYQSPHTNLLRFMALKVYNPAAWAVFITPRNLRPAAGAAQTVSRDARDC